MAAPRAARLLSPSRNWYNPVPRARRRECSRQNGVRLNVSASSRTSWIAPVALAVALLSLLANGILLSRLSHPERIAAPAVGRVLDRLGSSDASIKYQVRVPSGTPLHFDVPFDQTYRIRLNASFPINTTVAVPLKGRLGPKPWRSPIRTAIP